MSRTGQDQLSRSNSDYSLPGLGSASSSKVEIIKEYKSGAKYQGQVDGTRKAGRGVFIWPNGARYEGEFVDNNRQGKGIQTWADESNYDGEFEEDMRHGQGHHTWANGESYKGTYFRDRRHGKGVYTWPDQSFFTGSFYMDRKESYGTLLLANGNKFEGLYKADEREGPGVLTYPDGRQDVGMWHRKKLVRLCTSDANAFSIKDHPELEYFPEEHEQYIDMNTNNNNTDVVSGIVAPPDQFNYPPAVDISQRVSEVFSDTLHFNSSAVDVKVFEDEFFKDCEINRNKVKAWNNTSSMIAMQKHTLRYNPFQSDVSFDVDKVIQGDRTGFGEKGPLEVASERLLKSAMKVDTETLKNLLNNEDVDADVADNQGHNALLAASINWHQDAINIILDNGANVNKLNDQGVSSLSACHVYYFPADSFKYNIAERELEKPADAPQEPGYDVNEAVKTLIPASPKRKAPGPQSKKKSIKETELKKIHKLRQEYAKGGKKLQEIFEGKERAESGNQDLDCLEEPLLSDEQERTIGQLQINRVSKQNIEAVMAYDEMHLQSNNNAVTHATYDFISDEENWSETEVNDFESIKSVRNMPIEVSDNLIERSATQLSSNNLVVDRNRSAQQQNAGTVRELAVDKFHHVLMQSVIDLLLKRGADPNASAVPMPVLFFAIKGADVTAVHKLLVKGASTTARLSPKKGGLTPLHIAVAIPGDEGVLITELLLHTLAHPDARAAEDDSYLNHSLEEEWSKDIIDESSQKLLGGRTPLHITCARDDNYKNACRVVRLLLQHHANPKLLCNGHSPLALAIISGNDLAIDELLVHGADVCLPLTHGVGSALCVAAHTDYETRRTPEGRIKLIDKLIQAGGDVLAPIPIGPKRVTGTAVDYAYYVYNLDRRIAHMPYHALTHAERETFNARRELLSRLGDILRDKAVERERLRLQTEEAQGESSRSPSPKFAYTGAGGKLPASREEGHVTFGRTLSKQDSDIRKPMFRYCYECGRSIGVRLSPCTRCKEVFYCSKACKLKAWNTRHKEECVRVQGRSRSPSPNRAGGNRIDSPTPGTDPDAGKPNTVAGIMAGSSQRIKLPPIGKSGMVGRHSDHSPLSSDNESTDSATNYRRKKGDNSKAKRRSSGKSNKSTLKRSASLDNFDNEAGNHQRQGRMKDNWVKGRGRDLERTRSKGRSREDRSGGKQSERPSKSGKSGKSHRTHSEGRERPGKNKEDEEYEEFLKVKYGKNKPVRTGPAALEDANEFEEFLKLKERVKKRGLSGLDLANNPLIGKPPKAGQRNPAVFLLKLPLNPTLPNQQPRRYKSGAIMDRAMQMALLRLRENEMKDHMPYNPWRMVDGKWVYFDNYSFV